VKILGCMCKLKKRLFLLGIQLSVNMPYKQGIIFRQDFLPPHMLESMILIHLYKDISGKPKFGLKIVPPPCKPTSISVGG